MIGHEEVFARTTINPDYKLIASYLSNVKDNVGEECHFICGYEAGCLGYSLYHELKSVNIECIILAPTTMAATKRKYIKNDKRDAKDIAKCLAFGTYSPVYVPSKEDNAVKEYIRMRDDAKDSLKRNKQQIISLCTRHGRLYTSGSKWTKRYLDWLKTLDFGNILLNETLQEYLITYHQVTDRIEVFDKRINELANTETYKEKVSKLTCFYGIATHTALATIVEIGDFNRFPTAGQFAAYLGIVPGENSSGDAIRRTGITKAGNTHVRKLLTEAAQCYSRGTIGSKSKALKARQAGNDSKVIAYADKAGERLRRKYHRLMAKKGKRSIVVTAITRELACFIWGMMTDNTA
jgi:transposase